MVTTTGRMEVTKYFACEVIKTRGNRENLIRGIYSLDSVTYDELCKKLRFDHRDLRELDKKTLEFSRFYIYFLLIQKLETRMEIEDLMLPTTTLMMMQVLEMLIL